ncbi:hypothetical protein [Spirosoma validum]|uniref:Uncharacterized protein n=1 Tax=Spirosoma validum TaxID=2771355 RepID=A0A927B2W8_9BACT|nr:hypothetical protein [Spirosoma validum]MBD2754338.1 hypothetical protein [Spirosoma validum]
MNKLSRDQLNHLEQHIQKTNPHQALQAELLDHIASLIEQRMDQGHPFPVAFDQVMQRANPQVLAQLKELYLREFSVRFSSATLTVSRVRLRSKRRPATRPFQYMLLSSILTFLLLMGFLIIVSRPLAVPIGAFQTAWGAGLAGLMSVFFVRWWLSRSRHRPKRLLTA